VGHLIHDVGVSKHIGHYRDAMETAPGLRWLYTSGTLGITDSGAVAGDIEAQTRLAWKHILNALYDAGMTVTARFDEFRESTFNWYWLVDG
jgi:enamine deaminase RidA (YjgF/YER057c/UK114 family)